jgi:GNAT superfamily N-acetyltransferase
MKLSFVRVTDHNQAMQLRYVRNECRQFMTRDTHEITVEGQERFFWKELVTGDEYEAYLLYDYRLPIGYGMLHRDDSKTWMSMGLIASVRGKGLGTLLARLITAVGLMKSDVWLEVWGHNFPAVAAYCAAGYRHESGRREEQDVIYTMVCRRPIPPLTAEQIESQAALWGAKRRY